MAVKRIVSTSFWSDSKVDTFSPEDKYFMLYLLTNPHTTQLGIYEFSMKHAAFEMGYSVETVQALLSRFQDRYRIIMYCQDTGEIAIKNYLKHSIVKGGKPVLDCLKKELRQVKSKDLVKFVFSANQNSENATVREFILYIREIYKYNLNDNDNDNDNERIVDDSSDDVPSEPKKPKRKRKSDSAEEVETAIKAFGYPESTNERLREWLEVRRAKRTPNTVSAIQKCIKTLPDMARKSNLGIDAYLDQVIMRGWAAFYEIKTYQPNNAYGRTHTQDKQQNKATEEVNARIFEELFGGEPT